MVEAQEGGEYTRYGGIDKSSTSEMAGLAGRGEAPQKATHSWEHHCIHDLLAQRGKGGLSGGIDDLYQVSLLHDGDIADTRMPCQGPAHIQHSKTTEKAVNLECRTA